jgi:Oligonucleotide/oligosaccharide-binding (OB)-fold
LKQRRKQDEYCSSNFLSGASLALIADFRTQLRDILKDLGYLDSKSDFNSNSENWNLVKAAIVAGMYPNVASIQLPPAKFEETGNGAMPVLPLASDIHFYTKEGRAFVHPSSLIFGERKFDESVLIFGSKVSTSKIFLRDCTAAPPIGLLLMGGELELRHEGTPN